MLGSLDEMALRLHLDLGRMLVFTILIFILFYFFLPIRNELSLCSIIFVNFFSQCFKAFSTERSLS